MSKWIAWLGVWAALAGAARGITLDACIRAALANNPDAEAAQRRLTAAQAAAREAQSAWYPWVNLAAGYQRSDNPPQAFFMRLNQRSATLQEDFNHPDDTENLRGTVSAQWRLFDLRRGADNQMARLGAEVGGAQLAAVRNQLIYEVTRNYYSALQAQGFIDVQAEAVRSLEESLRVAQERFKAGSTVKTDVLNLEVQLAQAREDLIRAQNGFLLALAALNTAIGRDVVAAEDLRPADIREPVAPPATADPEAIRDRPELQAAMLLTRVQETAWRKAQREYAPVISAFGSSDWDSDVSTDFQQSYTVGVLGELNVFDGFRTRAALAAARARYEAARADEQQARNRLKLDLTQAHLGAQEAWQRLQVTRKSLESAEEARRITQEQYRQGAADITLLLTAQVGQIAQRTRDVAARYDYLTALSNLARAQGARVQEYGAGGDEADGREQREATRNQ